jgi:hypothetical protein
MSINDKKSSKLVWIIGASLATAVLLSIGYYVFIKKEDGQKPGSRPTNGKPKESSRPKYPEYGSDEWYKAYPTLSQID